MSRESFVNRDRNHGSASHRRAPKQEKELAERMKGRRVPGSGSGSEKGDVKKAHGIYRIEAKTTKNKSFSVTRDMIDKLEIAALPHNEVPALIVEFIDETGKPQGELAIIPTYALEVICES